MIPILHNTLEAGKVVRYHAVPTVKPQNVAHHSWNVAMLLIYISDNLCSRELLVEALMHDTGEIETGDIPYTVKRDNPELKRMLHELELIARADRTILPATELIDADAAILKVCDTLDGFIWCALHEDKRGPVNDRWHQAYLNARTKFRDLLTRRQWEQADTLFIRYGGILTDTEGEPFAYEAPKAGVPFEP